MEATPGVKWGICVRAGTDLELESAHAGERLATASIGKVLLLLATARLIADGELDPFERLDRGSALDVADSGVWQHLDQADLAVSDLAALVGLASDNLATNVLLKRVGFDAVDEVRSDLGLTDTRLNDYVRDVRTPDHPPASQKVRRRSCSSSSSGLREPSGPLSEAQRMTVGWLGLGSDLSMVASAFNLDPARADHHDSRFHPRQQDRHGCWGPSGCGVRRRSWGLCDLCGDRQLGRARNARRRDG